MKHRKRIITIAVIMLFILACSIVAYAFFTDRSETNNVFVFGDVNIVPREPNWDSASAVLAPNEEIAKDPQVANNGNEEAVIFAMVDIPVNTFTLINENGTKGNETTDTIFDFGHYTGDKFVTGLNTGWVQLKASSGEKDGEYCRYIFGYTKILGVSDEHIDNPLSPDEKVWAGMTKTTPIFDAVKLKNILEGTLSDGNKNINISFYAVQAKWIADNSGKYLTGTESDDAEDGFVLNSGDLSQDILKEIWNLNIAAENDKDKI